MNYDLDIYAHFYAVFINQLYNTLETFLIQA